MMTKIFAHRGSKGTHPENTLLAFEEAVALGVEGIELDVQLTKDEQLVVIHDNTVSRTTNGEGEITDFTLSEIQKLDAGSWFNPQFAHARIPSFDDVLVSLVNTNFRGILNIEVKTDEKSYPGIEKKLVARVNKEQWPFEIMYSSFNFTTLEKLYQLDQSKSLAYIMYTSENELAMVKNIQFIDAVHPKFQWVQEQMELAKHYPLALRPWTVNELVDMRLAFECQLSGIHTDFPELALNLRHEIQGKGEKNES